MVVDFLALFCLAWFDLVVAVVVIIVVVVVVVVVIVLYASMIGHLFFMLISFPCLLALLLVLFVRLLAS